MDPPSFHSVLGSSLSPSAGAAPAYIGAPLFGESFGFPSSSTTLRRLPPVMSLLPPLGSGSGAVSAVPRRRRGLREVTLRSAAGLPSRGRGRRRVPRDGVHAASNLSVQGATRGPRRRRSASVSSSASGFRRRRGLDDVTCTSAVSQRRRVSSSDAPVSVDFSPNGAPATALPVMEDLYAGRHGSSVPVERDECSRREIWLAKRPMGIILRLS